MITRLKLFTRRVSSSLFLLSLLVPLWASSVPTIDQRPSVFDLVSGQDLVEVTLETDMVRMMENMKTDLYQSAIFSFENEKGEPVSFQAEIRSRGNYRRRVCDFPPLKIKFHKDQLVGANFKPHNKLKLVTHCLDSKSIGHENLLKEYLAYQLYRELTDLAYRVQLVQINYKDTQGKLSKIKRYALLIEDTDEMAERLGGEECDCLNPQKENLNNDQEGIHAMFQYMIGNEDWSLAMGRNIKMVKPLNGNTWTIVPYDFDFSGIVNASYAIPNENYGLTSVQDRIYLGMPASDQEIKKLFHYFRVKEADLYQLVNNFKPLSKTGRSEVIDYLHEFFQIIDEIENEVGSQLYEAMSTQQIESDGGKVMNSGK